MLSAGVWVGRIAQLRKNIQGYLVVGWRSAGLRRWRKMCPWRNESWLETRTEVNTEANWDRFEVKNRLPFPFHLYWITLRLLFLKVSKLQRPNLKICFMRITYLMFYDSFCMWIPLSQPYSLWKWHISMIKWSIATVSLKYLTVSQCRDIPHIETNSVEFCLELNIHRLPV